VRVLIVHGERRPPGEMGGAESLLRDQAKALKARGHDVAWWYGRGTLEQACNNFQPDFVHVMTIHCYIGMGPLEWLQAQKIPHLMHVQDYWPFCGGRMLMRGFDEPCPAVTGLCDQCQPAPKELLDITNKSFIVAGNEHTAAIYRRNGIRCDYVVELGVDTEMFKPGEKKAGSVCTSAAFAAAGWKGMHILKEGIVDSDIDVTLITGVPREKVAEMLRAADIYVFPSIYEETFGLCLCEAMASGCACIATDVAGARAQIDHNVTGMLVPPRNPDALRDAIDYMLTHPSHKESMAFVARKHVEKSHTLNAMAERWEAVYEKVLHGV
jgi:glycosyltransferase involved in cell wall biosynthesis